MGRAARAPSTSRTYTRRMDAEPDPQRFRRLPRTIRVDETITSADVNPVPDVEGGRDTERDFLIRYGLGGLF